MADKFAGYAAGLTAPLTDGMAVGNGGGDVTLAQPSRALMVAGAGDVVVEMLGAAEGVTLTLPGLQPGIKYPDRVRKVLQSGTTATGAIDDHTQELRDGYSDAMLRSRGRQIPSGPEKLHLDNPSY